MQGFQEAEAYLSQSWDMREVLGIARKAKLAAVPLGCGEHNANFSFVHPDTGERYVLRINYASQLGLEHQISYEANALRVLESSKRVPKVLFVDDSRKIISRGVLVEGCLAGSLLDFENGEMVREAAATMADIHALELPEDCGLLKPSDPLAEQHKTCRGYFSNYCASRYAEPQVARFVEGLFDAAEMLEVPRLSDADCSHAINTEAVPSHFIMPIDSNGHVTGPGHMLDWEKPIIGEVAQDVAYFLSPTTTIWDTDYIFDRKTRKEFLEEYWRAVDGRFEKGMFEERFPAYVMSNCLLGITWSCNAWVEYHNPDRPLKSAETFELLGRYLSMDFLRSVREICFKW